MSKQRTRSKSRRNARPDATRPVRAGPSAGAAARDRLLAHIDGAAARLQHRRPITDEDVHEARKSIKRARAVLRLLQPALDAGALEHSRRALRDAGRALAPVRDARVLIDRLEEMLDRTGIDRFPVNTISEPAAASHSSTRRPRARHQGRPAAARAGLQQARAWLSGATLRDEGSAPLATGIRAIYRSGRNHLPTDVDAAASQALHEWRKRTKNYQYAMEVIAEIERPPRARRTIGSARRLADALGEEHDLALLDDALRTCDASDDARVTTLLEAIRRRRRRLRRRALEVGADLYADTPAAMVKKLRRRK